MKVLFNSIIRTMYSGCYYKKGSRVIYLYDIKQTGDSQTVIFFECEHISRPKEITVLYNEFRPVGEPKPSTSLILSLSLDMRTISIRDASAAFIAKRLICSQM